MDSDKQTIQTTVQIFMRALGNYELIQIKTVTKSSDGAGGFTFSTSSQTIRAEVVENKATIQTERGINIATTYTFTFAKRSEVVITADKILVYRGREFTIKSILENRREMPIKIEIIATTNDY